MQCLAGCLALTAPRVAVAVLWIVGYLPKAYETLLWPLLGFLFLPLTTIAYAWAINERGDVEGLHLAALVVAVLFDLGLIGGSARKRRGAEKPAKG